MHNWAAHAQGTLHAKAGAELGDVAELKPKPSPWKQEVRLRLEQNYSVTWMTISESTVSPSSAPNLWATAHRGALALAPSRSWE